MTTELLPIVPNFDLPYETRGDTFIVWAPKLAQYLGFRDAHDLLVSLPESVKGYGLVRTLGGEQRAGFVTEAGFYQVMGQRQTARVKDPAVREIVEAFQHWVFAEFLPAMRRGEVDQPKELTGPELMAKALVYADAQIKALEATVAQNSSKVVFFDAVATSGTSILVRELAKLLQQAGVRVSPNNLFEWLRHDGFLIRQKSSDYNLPTQKSIKLGLFEIKETPIVHDSGAVTISRTPKVTGKGQTYFIDFYKEQTK